MMDVPSAVMMTSKEILEILREEKQYLKEKYGLLAIGLFGSCAKDTHQPESDIDLIVELSEPRFDFLAGLQIYLESRLGKPVELIRKRNGLSSRFLRRIERDIRYV
jgi:uncharacterized protein